MSSIAPHLLEEYVSALAQRHAQELHVLNQKLADLKSEVAQLQGKYMQTLQKYEQSNSESEITALKSQLVEQEQDNQELKQSVQKLSGLLRKNAEIWCRDEKLLFAKKHLASKKIIRIFVKKGDYAYLNMPLFQTEDGQLLSWASAGIVADINTKVGQPITTDSALAHLYLFEGR